jgi:hypothetical protein
LRKSLAFLYLILCCSGLGCVHQPINVDYHSFRVLGSELDDPKELRIVFLGDVHQDYIYEAEMTKFINLHASPHDIVLLEGVPAGQVVSPDQNILTFGMNPTLKFIGWDDMSLNLQAQAFQVKIDAEEAKHDPGSIHELKELSNQRNQVAIIKRNNLLIKTIEYYYYKYPTAKIFIIAGERHYTSDPRLGIYFTKKPHLALAISPEEETHDIRVDNGHHLYVCNSANKVFLIKMNDHSFVADQTQLNHIVDKYQVIGLKCLR